MRNRCFAEKVSSRPRYISASQWYPKGGERPRSSSRFSPRRPASESVKPRVMPRCNRSSSYSIDEKELLPVTFSRLRTISFSFFRCKERLLLRLLLRSTHQERKFRAQRFEIAKCFPRNIVRCVRHFFRNIIAYYCLYFYINL